MDIQSMKLDLISWLATVDDPVKILSFLKLREEFHKAEEGADLQPMTHEELIERAKASEKAIEEGRVHDIEDLAKAYL